MGYAPITRLFLSSKHNRYLNSNEIFTGGDADCKNTALMRNCLTFVPPSMNIFQNKFYFLFPDKKVVQNIVIKMYLRWVNTISTSL